MAFLRTCRENRGRLLVLLCLAVARAGGQDNNSNTTAADPALLKQLTLEQLSEIEVTTPSKEPVPVRKSPVAVFVITGEDIRRSGATTIPDALRLAPGVEVAQINGSQWSIGIRGFGTDLSRAVLVMIDGRSVYTPLFAGTYWDVQDTLLEDVDRIEVIRGPGGTIWGPNAVNGVINIITKSTKDTTGAYAAVGGGNELQGYAGARVGGGNSKGLTYRLYGKSFTRSPQYHATGDNFDDWRGAQTGFRTDWSHGQFDEFTVQGDLYAHAEGQQAGLANYVPAFQKLITENASLSGGNLLGRWTHRTSDQDSIQVQTYYDRTNRFGPNFGENRDTFDIDYLQNKSVGPRHQFSFGAGARSSHGHFHQVGSGLVFNPVARTDYLLSAFFQDDIQLIAQQLTLSVGIKVLRTNFNAFSAQPTVRLLWTPDDQHTFWAAFTKAVRTPSRAEHDLYLSSYFGTDANTGLNVFARFDANPQFAPEQLNGYEAGYRQLLRKNLSIDVATFWNHYHDLFSQNLIGGASLQNSVPFPDPNTVPTYILLATGQFRNDFRGFTAGGEIASEWRPTDAWRLRGSYSYLNMHLVAAPSSIATSSPQSVTGASPRHEATAQSSFDLPKKVQLDLAYRYMGALPALGVPSYSTGDARVAWRFMPQLELSVTGRNLFQPHHLEYAGGVQIRRTVFASVAWIK